MTRLPAPAPRPAPADRSPGRRGARRRGAAALALAALAGAALLLDPAAAGTPAAAAPVLSRVAVDGPAGAGRVASGHLLAYNDFHGAIDPPGGSGAAVAGVPAGGVEYLATWLQRRRSAAAAQGQPTVTVGAGDLIGASPLVSAAFHDEPTIALMDLVGLDVSAVGNHEFDEGVAELLRIDRGGCHPVDGCADGDGYPGARFRYLAANTVDRRTRLPILPPVSVRTVQGVPVGFVGMTLKGTPGIVNPAGVAGVEFLDEARTANRWAARLRLLGVRALVLLLHEGGAQRGPNPSPSGCADFAGPVVDIVRKLAPEFGAVVSGHTHRYYTCTLPNAAGAPTVVTSAGNNGQLITDLAVRVDRRTGRFAGIRAENHAVVNGVPDGQGGWQRDPAGGYLRDPALADPAARRLADWYRAAVAPLANRVVGRITADLGNVAGPHGEQPLGDVIADAQLARTRPAGAELALMNPGGVRAPLTFGASPGGEPPGHVTYGEAFAVQPFNNLVVTQTLTGAQVRAVLEQQFPGFEGQQVTRILQPSAGLRFSYDTRRAPGDRIVAVTLGGAPLDPARAYRVTTNDFLANGGDGFTALTRGTARAVAPGFDLDALTAYLGAGAPVAPGPGDRITKLG
ncbi:5'-nucleotidase [Pilimelia terevasa]|uniref:5'-nucleotidase n=1 Tax=Pilimelia terevasa TaxID=53372 RepID=A0A8J3BIX0_9ACTN|nr:bifunctional metallophosphatase/5'-nucleotidase [Pilimelia terevasa]GGK14361.1 5'-nucleotidase [Pilimelia terevasa]